jgi:hypothetical protein
MLMELVVVPTISTRTPVTLNMFAVLETEAVMDLDGNGVS